MTENEEFRRIPGLSETYKISRSGVIIRDGFKTRDGKNKGSRILKPSICPASKGYWMKLVKIEDNEGYRMTYSVGRLVLMAWGGEGDVGTRTVYLDGNPLNTNIENLVWSGGKRRKRA